MPKEGVLGFDDLVKGRMEKKAEDVQDFAIVRSDGSPIFHLANVVDDIDQGITDVIRGDDHVENTFKHIELFKALGATPPRYGHLPMIVNQQGKPYSKRDGAAFVGEFREQGYLPGALFNYLLLLGWNPGDEREVLTREEMVELFTLEKCHRTAAKFDMKKLQWMNGEYVRRVPKEDFKKEMIDRCAAQGLDTSNADLDGIVDQLQIRTKFFSDMPGNCAFFFTEDYPFDEKAVEKRLKKPGVKEILLDLADRFEKLEPFTIESGEAMVKELSQGQGMGPWVHPIRVAVSGRMEGPGLFEMLYLLGKEKTISRLRRVAQTI
jgi:glutamyl-tRNA synthetase